MKGKSDGWSLWKVALVLILCLTVLYAFFIRQDWMTAQLARERTQNHHFVGDAAATLAENRASRWFNAAFVDTGLMAKTLEITRPAATPPDDLKKYNKVANAVLAWWAVRLGVWWTMLYQLMIRLSMALLWVPFAAITLIPFLVDANVARRVKSTNFADTSPHLFTMGRKCIKMLPWLFLLSVLAPVCLPPPATPVMMGAAVLALWLSISHFIKRA